MTLSVLISAYLLGSFPTAIIISRLFFKIDICSVGSKNPGSTNVFRILGLKAALAVFVIDVLKGFLASKLIFLLPGVNLSVINSTQSQIICGILAFLGHLFPFFGAIKGGKGVATSFGVILGLSPFLALSSLGIFVTVLLLSRFVSLASLLAAVFFLIMSNSLASITPFAKIFYSGISLAIVLAHWRNIKRLFQGQEKKIQFCGPCSRGIKKQ